MSSSFDTVCIHLQPIINLLESNQCRFDWKTGVIPDRNDGSIFLSVDEIDFDLIKSEIDIPNFVILSPDKERVSCLKCWCSVERKIPGKIYSSSKQPK